MRRVLALLLFTPSLSLSTTALADGVAAQGASARRVMVLGIQAVGVDPVSVAALTDVLAREVARHPGYEVTSADDVRALQSAEAVKQQTGCSEDDACLAEIGRKLDADLILTSSVGLVGASYVLNLALVNPRAAGGTQRAFQSARRLEDLPGVVAPALSSVFHWSAGSTVAVAFHLPQGRKLSFAILDLRPTGLPPEVAQNLTQVLSVEVKGIEGASVVSRADIAAMLQLQAVKSRTGCDDDSCMAEIGGALGVDHLITGDAGKLGSTFIVNLRLLDVRHGAVENRVTESYVGEEDQLLRAVRTAARSLLGLSGGSGGRIAILANQAAADVFLDEAKKGQSPLEIASVQPGRHEVRATRDGFFDWHGAVYVDPTETTNIWAQLKARPEAWYQKWWVWTIAGVVIAGGTTGAVLATRPAPRVGYGTLSFQ